MRLTILSLVAASALAVAAASANAAPLGAPEAGANPGIVKVWGGCGPGARPVPGHWNRWGAWVPPHCAPAYYGPRVGYYRPYWGYHRYWY